MVAEAMRPESQSEIARETQNAAVVLQQALQCVPHFVLECVLRNYALSLGQYNAEEVRPLLCGKSLGMDEFHCLNTFHISCKGALSGS